MFSKKLFDLNKYRKNNELGLYNADDLYQTKTIKFDSAWSIEKE